jgi:hypothetical protein
MTYGFYEAILRLKELQPQSAVRHVSLNVTREPIEVQSIGHHHGDPEWVEVDPAGHEHRFSGDELPTCECVVTRSYWCHECLDMHDEHVWRCLACNHTVTPRWLWTGPSSSTIPGYMRGELVVEWEDEGGLYHRRPFELSDEDLGEAISASAGGQTTMFPFAEAHLRRYGVLR